VAVSPCHKKLPVRVSPNCSFIICAWMFFCHYQKIIFFRTSAPNLIQDADYCTTSQNTERKESIQQFLSKGWRYKSYIYTQFHFPPFSFRVFTLVTLHAISWKYKHGNNAILLSAQVGICDLDRADNILMALPRNSLKTNEHLCLWDNLVKSNKYLYQPNGIFCELAVIFN
jgi:hypothetical protein